jgi:hypothetical protein
MQVQIIKPSGETDTIFNVTYVQVNHVDETLIVSFNRSLANHSVSFVKEEWTNFITSH